MSLLFVVSHPVVEFGGEFRLVDVALQPQTKTTRRQRELLLLLLLLQVAVSAVDVGDNNKL